MSPPFLRPRSHAGYPAEHLFGLQPHQVFYRVHQEVMARVRRFKYRPNDDELKALNSLSRRERPCLCPVHVLSASRAIVRLTITPETTEFFSCYAGLAVWSGLWGTATSVVTYQVMRRISGGSGRARPIAIALISGAWVTGYRVQAFPVRCGPFLTSSPLPSAKVVQCRSRLMIPVQFGLVPDKQPAVLSKGSSMPELAASGTW